MNYAEIINYDIANGEGFRTSLFVSGCTNHCPGCFNPEQQDFNYGGLFGPNTLLSLRCMLDSPVISGLSILGGDPLCQTIPDMEFLCKLCDYTHSLGKTVWLWTGFIYEHICAAYNPTGNTQFKLLSSCDVVIDGPFVQEKADPSLKWRGSSNQRVIDMKKTLKQGQVVLYEV